MKKHQQPPAAQDAEARTEQALFEYLRRTGKIIPQTPEEIAEAQASLRPESVELPERLRAASVVERACKGLGQVLKMPQAETKGDVMENLARAAREGGELSDEVEVQMKLDRAKAEREADSDQ